MTDRVLSIWTIYDHPRDYPDQFVARRHEVHPTGPVATDDKVVSDNIDVLRDHFSRRGFTRLGRHPDDDPVIMECWL